MNAIRVARRAKTGGFTAHWLVDPGRTYCGLAPADLDVVETLVDPARLAPIEECRQCLRIVDRIKYTRDRPSDGVARVVLTPSLGRVRRTGPLSHGTRRTRGSALSG